MPEKEKSKHLQGTYDDVPDIMNDEALMEIAHYFFIQSTPFNQVLGMEIMWVKDDSLCVRFPMREDLIGNSFRGLLHGGVTASILDVVGGMASFFNLRSKMKGQSLEKAAERFRKFGTIDLRIDYLRPGKGKAFEGTAVILRSGSKIAVARMELHNDEGRLIAVGTGSYMIG